MLRKVGADQAEFLDYIKVVILYRKDNGEIVGCFKCGNYITLFAF